MRDPDVVVIGSGPNGLISGLRLARQGLSVLILEANPRRPGGALGSEEATLPGFVHDFGAGFFPLARLSPAFRELPLERHGVTWLNAAIESCHPALDGSSACIVRQSAIQHGDEGYFGSVDDTKVWNGIAREHARTESKLFDALLGPLPSWRALGRLGLGRVLRLGLRFASSSRRLSSGWFCSEAARRVLPALALHGDRGPDDFAGAAMAYVLAVSASSVGYPVPQGGAQKLTNALVTLLELSGAQVRLGVRIAGVIVRSGRAVAVRTASGDEIPARYAVLADTSPGALLRELVAEHDLPAWARRSAAKFRHGWGTFKIDWALSSAVPWRDQRARQSATVHLGESIDDLARYTREVRAGKLPEQPYVVVGQQSLVDASRAPPGAHTLYAYTHVPSDVPGGWEAQRERCADSIEERIQALAPGFRNSVLGRRALTPEDLSRTNANLVGGDLGGGSSVWSQQLVLRPFFPNFRYRMPLRGLYLCSSSTHPGGGVHGMCGYNAAGRVLKDLERTGISHIT